MTRARTAGLLATLVLAIPGFLQGGDRGVNRIHKITYSEDTEETVIKVSADETPTFSVFKLDDPVRLFIDVSRGETESVSNPLVIDNGVIDQIGTLQFKSGGVPVGRVIIGLRDNVPYDVTSQGNDIVIRVDGQGRRPSDGQVRNLSDQVTSLKDRLDRERELLAQIRQLRKQEESLRSKEEASRTESERLRAAATALKQKALEEASRASTRAKGEEERLVALKASASKAEEATKIESQRLELIKREREVAAREQEALAAAAVAAREEADAMKKLAAQATARRQAEEAATASAAQARKAAQAAVATEESKLESARNARRAEEAHQAAIKELAEQEGQNLAQTRAAREREEALLARIADARAKESRTADLARESHDAALAAELEATKKRVADLNHALIKEREQASRAAVARDEAYQSAVATAQERESGLVRAKAATASMESRLREIQADRDRLANVAKDAKAEAERMKALSEQATVIAQQKESARQQAEALSSSLAEKKQELASLKTAIESEESQLEAMALRKNHETERLASVSKRLTTEEEQLSLLTSERSRVEGSVNQLRKEVDDLVAKRKAVETDEARELRKQLEKRQREVDGLKGELVAARTKASGKRSERETNLARKLAGKEVSITQLRAEYESALLQARSEGKAIRARYEERLNKAKAEGEWKDETIRDLADKIARAQDEVVTSRDALAAREAEIRKLRSSLSQAESTGQESVAHLRKTLERKVAEAESVRTDLADRLARTDDLASRRAAEIARLSQELKRFKAASQASDSGEVKDMKARLEARAMEIQVLKRAYQDAKNDKRSNRKGQKKRLASLKKSLEQQKRESKRLKREYEQMKATQKGDLKKRDRRISALTDQIEALKADRAASESRKVAKLHKLVTEKESEITVLQERNQKATAAQKDLSALKKKLKVATIRERKARDNEIATADKADRLMHELTGTRAERDLLVKELEKTKDGLRQAENNAAMENARIMAELRKEKDGLRQAENKAAMENARIMAELRKEKDGLRQAENKAAMENARMMAELRKEKDGLRQAENNAAEERATIRAELQKERDRRTHLSRELDKVKAAVAKTARKPVTRKPVSSNSTSASVQSVDFKEVGGVPSVVLNVGRQPDYKVVKVNDRSYVLTLQNTSLPSHMARRMDVTAFESPVSMVTSFSDGKGSVQVVVDLAEPIGQRAHFADGNLVWKFQGQPTDRMFAGAAPTPTTGSRRMIARAPAESLVPTMAAPKTDTPPKYRKPSMVPKKKKYKGRRINLTVKDADIQNVLTFLAREGKINIVTSENVRGKVTFHLEDVQWDLALDTVLKAKGLDYVVEQDIYRVAPVEEIQNEYEARVKKMQKVRELKPVLVRLIPVNYGDGNALVARVKSVLSDKGVVTVDIRTNTLIIKDTEDYLTAAEELVRRLDKQTPQVLIEARIVEARTTFKEDIGIQWGGKFAMGAVHGNETGLVFPSSIGIAGGADDTAAPTGGISYQSPNFAVNLPAAVGAGAGGAIGIQLGSIGGASNLSLRLSAAEEEGNVKIISSPRISTLDNTKATISQGVAIPISVVSAAGVNTQFFSADLKLDVVPHVTRDGHILLKLDITKNEPDFGNVAANGNPTIQKKEAHTELLIRDGDTTVIGGIYTRSKGTSFKKVPFFGDIPILGWFFKSRNRSDDRSELLIFITPKVVNREVAL